MSKKHLKKANDVTDIVAGGGLVNRRALFWSGALAAGGLGGMARAAQIGEKQPEYMRVPGAGFREYGQPSPHEAGVKRNITLPYGHLANGAGISTTPLEHLRGVITPNGLHFNRSHNGVPDIDPDKHELVIHGLVRRPLKFDMATLLRYPSVSHNCFIECSGNSYFNGNFFKDAPQLSVGRMHGMVSSSEWTGVPLSVLFEEAGIKPGARWVLAEGADAAAMTRSIPLEKCLDDAMLALYQNGERLRPEQGYPLRLLLPGFEGNMSIKWLRRLKVVASPMQTREETAKYTDLLPDGRARQFSFHMGVKSVITHPSSGFHMQGPGLYEISGLAWTGAGRISRVEISADGGASWAEAALGTPNISCAQRRFSLAWRWDGGPCILQSRATDEKGNTQPTRELWNSRYGARQVYHCNAIQSWAVGADGGVRNVFA